MFKYPMDKFLLRYNCNVVNDEGGILADWGIHVNPDMVKFARGFYKYLKRTCPGCRVRKFSRENYDISGFLEKDGKLVYFDYKMPACGRMIDIWKRDWPDNGVLVRRAQDIEDFFGRGGRSQYCNLYEIGDFVTRLLAS